MGKIDLNKNTSIFPRFNIGWIRNLKTEGSSADVGFVAGGKSTKTTSTDLIENIFNLGAEINIPHGDNVFNVRYDFTNGYDYTSHAASLRYKIVF